MNSGKRMIIGQALLIICCVFYLLWWYRGYRPGTVVNRMGGINGVLLAITAVFGISGIACCLMPSSDNLKTKIDPMLIVVAGIAAYIVLLLVTRLLFHRPVTTELFLIVGWCMLEMTVINRLNALGSLEGSRFVIMCAVTAAAVIASLVLYVLYYRMEEMRAFYAAMVPLVTEAAAMGILVILYCTGKSGAA